jgi:hypothetical protein
VTRRVAFQGTATDAGYPPGHSKHVTPGQRQGTDTDACIRIRTLQACRLGETCYPVHDKNVRIKWGRGVRNDAPVPPSQFLAVSPKNLIVRYYTNNRVDEKLGLDSRKTPCYDLRGRGARDVLLSGRGLP